jgi:hypothetical protein
VEADEIGLDVCADITSAASVFIASIVQSAASEAPHLLRI